MSLDTMVAQLVKQEQINDELRAAKEYRLLRASGHAARPEQSGGGRAVHGLLLALAQLMLRLAPHA